MSEPKALRKLTPATIMELGRKAKLPAPTEQTALYIVYGVAQDAQEKPTSFSDTQKVIYGKFVAIRASDQQKFTGDTLYLPEPYHTRIANAVSPPPVVDKKTGVVNRTPSQDVEFALKVSYAPGESPTGYVFTVEDVVENRANDRLAQIAAGVESKLAKLLPAPSKADVKPDAKK